jgi:hypothetical protein
MGIILGILEPAGSITIGMSGVQSVQFTRGVDGAMCLLVLIGVGLWMLAGWLVKRGIGGCCGGISWVGFSGLRLEGLICMCGSLLIWVERISLFVMGLVLRV